MSIYHASLAAWPKITYQRWQKLFKYFPNFNNLWEAEWGELSKAGLEDELAQEFITWREQNPPEKLAVILDKEKITTVALGEPDYPRLLAEIADPPFSLFVRGELELCDEPALGVVGTRKFSAYGQRVCEEITSRLAAQGMIIVSGLALGIDGIAHQAALNAGGKTIAVLGTGINRHNIYPVAHQPLAEKILAQGGTLITEYPPGFEATKYSFPARNRIIAGLTLGTLVIEAPESSGALITAKCALDYNREVFAIPHPITSLSGVGNNSLLKMGAHLVTMETDITDALNLKNLKTIVDNRKILPSSPTEEAILNCLSREPKHVDLIFKESGLSGPAASSALTLMEMKGMIRNVGGMNYLLSR